MRLYVILSHYRYSADKTRDAKKQKPTYQLIPLYTYEIKRNNCF